MNQVKDSILSLVKKVESPDQLLKKLRQKLDFSDLLIWIVVFLTGFINNFYFILGHGVAPDALLPSYFNVAGNWEVTLGRFSIRYVNLVRNGLVSKFLIIFISLSCIAMVIMLLKRLFKIKSKVLLFVLCTLISVAPQFTETYMFIFCADAYLVAFFLSILSVYFLDKTRQNKWYYIWSILCIILVSSLYQAYLGVIIGTTILLVLKYIFDHKSVRDCILKFLTFMVTIFVGIVCYYLLLKIILHFKGLSLASYKGADSLGIHTILQLPNSIWKCYQDFYFFFFGNSIIKNSFWKREIIYVFLFSISFLSVVQVFFHSLKDHKWQRIVCILFLVFLFPIGISTMNLIAPSTKINLVTGPGLLVTVLFVVILYHSMNFDSISNLCRYALLGGVLLVSWTYLLGNTYNYMAREQTFENFKFVASDIYTKVTSLENYSENQKWMFSDVIRFTPNDSKKANGFISANYETWNHYKGTLQNVDFYSKYFGIKIKMCNKKTYDAIVKTEKFKNMPTYPSKDSIQIIDDVIVIKMSEKIFK